MYLRKVVQKTLFFSFQITWRDGGGVIVKSPKSPNPLKNVNHQGLGGSRGFGTRTLVVLPREVIEQSRLRKPPYSSSFT